MAVAVAPAWHRSLLWWRSVCLASRMAHGSAAREDRGMPSDRESESRYPQHVLVHVHIYRASVRAQPPPPLLL